MVFLVAQNYISRHTRNAAMRRISSRYCNSSPLLLIQNQKSCTSTFAYFLNELWAFVNVYIIIAAYQQLPTKANIETNPNLNFIYILYFMYNFHSFSFVVSVRSSVQAGGVPFFFRHYYSHILCRGFIFISLNNRAVNCEMLE